MNSDSTFQCVATSGNDNNDGLSWATPKLTVGAAVYALPNGGLIMLAPGQYPQTQTLVLNGHHLCGMGQNAGSDNATVGIVCEFLNAPLIHFSHGGQLTNVGLIVQSSDGESYGDAVYCLSPAFASVRGGTGSAFLPPGVLNANGAVNSIIGVPPCTGFTPDGYIAIDAEVFQYSAFTNAVFTITARAAGGTAAESHAVATNSIFGAVITQATVLSGVSLSTTDTTAYVESTAGWSPSGYLIIDPSTSKEIVFYTGITSNSFTGLQRGRQGYSAQPHLGNAACVQYASRAGQITLYNVYVGGGFARAFHLDGSNANYPGGPGVRQIQVSKGLWFGAQTPGETILLNRVVHANFEGIDINPAQSFPNGSVNQGIKVLDSMSEQIYFANQYVLGDLISEAAGEDGNPFGTVLFEGHVGGNVTFIANSAGNRVIGPILGTVTNNGMPNNITDKQPWTPVTTVNSPWTNMPGHAVELFLDASGVVHLRGSVVWGGEHQVESEILTLMSGYFNPTTSYRFLACGSTKANGVVPCAITIANGVVSLDKPVPNGPSLDKQAPEDLYSLSFDGITFSVLS